MIYLLKEFESDLKYMFDLKYFQKKQNNHDKIF